MIVQTLRIASYQRAILFRDGDPAELLGPGLHRWLVSKRRMAEYFDTRRARILSSQLDVMVRSGVLGDDAKVVELGDAQRALVWMDGRLTDVLGPGLHAYWTVTRDIRVEVLDASEPRLQRPDLAQVLAIAPGSVLSETVVREGHVGLVYVDRQLGEQLQPGRYAFWAAPRQTMLKQVDLRERMTDITSQELMTSDRVTLRLNAYATWRVVDPVQAVSATQDYEQAIYREGQLVLRRIVGTLSLGDLLERREALGNAFLEAMSDRAEQLGVVVAGFGLRDIILPGDMKHLLNRVMEARTAAEAALITRREETAAMRSQANTAKLLEKNPTLMRLRELEVLETIATQTNNFNLVLGDKGMAERVVNLL